MCPVCISTAAMMVAGMTSTGGVAVLVVKKLLQVKSGLKAAPLALTISAKENHNAQA